MARIINSPGVQITEIDKSLNVGLNAGTNVLACGFAPQGPTDELIYVTGKEDFEQTFFGVNGPTNAAERYFYHSCKEILNSPANLLVTRMPYGSGNGIGFDGEYSALIYPVSSLLTAGATSTIAYTSATYFKIGTPVLTSINETQLIALQDDSINWGTVGNGGQSFADAGFIIVNTAKTTINENYEGFYVALADNGTVLTSGYDAVQSIRSINSAGSQVTVPTSMLAFSLTGTEQQNSISRTVETAPNFAFELSGYKDSLIVYVFKLAEDIFGNDSSKLQAIPYETYVGSFNPQDKESNTLNGQLESFYLGDKINPNSNFVNIFVNKNFRNNTVWIAQGENKTELEVTSKTLNGVGTYAAKQNYANTKILGSVPTKLERALILAENRDVVNIDVVAEAGLGTAWSYVSLNSTQDTAGFDDETDVTSGLTAIYDANTGGSSEFATSYRTVFNLFENFARENRKDCIFYADGIRGIFVNGRDTKILSRKTNTFSQHVYIPLRNLFGAANSNFAATYANWVKIYDGASAKYSWMPFSGWQSAITARLDANLYPWFAPAGLNNGVIRNITDIAINPTQKQRDLLYKIGINPVVFFPQDGFVVWGQKTLQAKPSAFDRINVRRLFLALEKATLRLARYFVMEPNTVYTRTRFVNTLRPIFELAKNTEGVYDYQIVCDERNNTPDVIDQNELKVDIYIKPVRTAEFILINFIATRTGQDFNELIG